MDAHQFDDLVARLTNAPSRRSALKGILGGAVAVLGVRSIAEGNNGNNSNGNGRKRRRRRRKHQCTPKAGETRCRKKSCVNLQTSNTNCGACRHTCPANTTCQAGICTATCTASGGICVGTPAPLACCPGTVCNAGGSNIGPIPNTTNACAPCRTGGADCAGPGFPAGNTCCASRTCSASAPGGTNPSTRCCSLLGETCSNTVGTVGACCTG